MTQAIDLISKVISDQSLPNFRSVKREWINPGDEQVLYNFVNDYVSRYGHLPSFAALEENGYILSDPDDSFNYYRDIVADRHLIHIAQSQYTTLSQAIRDMDADALRAAIRALSLCMATSNSEVILTDLHTESLSAIEIARQTLRRGMLGYTCGYDVFDDENGGHQLTNLDIYVGRPNTGKSYFLLRDAYKNWRNGVPILFVSLEMSNVQMAARLLALYADMSPNRFKTGEITTYQRGRLNHLIASMVDDTPFYFLSGQQKTVEAVESAMSTVDTPLVYIDAGYLLKSKNRKFGNRADNIAHATEDLKAIADRENRCIITTVQFNRGASIKAKNTAKEKDKNTDATPDLEDIGGSDALGQQASNIYGLMSPNKDPLSQSKRRIVNMKNRDGNVGSQLDVNFKFVPKLDLDPIGVVAANESGSVADGTGQNMEWMV